MSTGGKATGSGIPAAKWLILLALGWSQIGSAVHQLEHDAHELEETCAVCLKFESSVIPLATVGQVGFQAAPTDWSDTDAPTYIPAEGISHYNARASP